MTKQELNEAVQDVWKTKLTHRGISSALKSAQACCGVGCEQCVWELTWIIRQLIKKK